MDDKTKSIVAHITLIGWIIALVMNQSDKGPNTSFYLRQNLGLYILAIVGSILGMLILPVISTIVGVCVLILWILSLLGALSGEQKTTPVVGDMFQILV
jgi:uncharacterized membrane protein